MTETEQARILIIDDEESIRNSLAAVLEEKGYLVDMAENGQVAIEKSKTKAYNLALIDIRLPDMEGTDLLTAIKENTPDMVGSLSPDTRHFRTPLKPSTRVRTAT